MIRYLIAWTLLTILPASAYGQAQRIRLAVSISDSATAGIFGSAFSSAFRSLGDVDVVGVTEKPQYVLDGVVMCEPKDCTAALSYDLSLRLYSPYEITTGQYLAVSIVSPTPKATYRTRVDSAANTINLMLDGYERSHMTWTANWGRQRYEQAIREMVGRIDSQCLDKQRALNRLFASQDTARFAAYKSLIDSKTWIC